MFEEYEDEIPASNKWRMDINTVALAEQIEIYKDDVELSKFLISLQKVSQDPSNVRLFRLPSGVDEKLLSKVLNAVLVEVINTTIH